MKRRRFHIPLRLLLMMIIEFLFIFKGTYQQCFPDARVCHGPPVTLFVGKWLGSYANANVAKTILEEKMGYCVNITFTEDNNSVASLAKSGKPAAILEVWPEGRKPLLDKYVREERSVVEGGALGIIGRIGWYVPSYVLERSDQYEYYRAYRVDELVEYFATNETGGNLGRFVGVPSIYVNYDDSIINNLKLKLKNIKVSNTTPESDLIEELDYAYRRRLPILFYFWTPQQIHLKYNLTRVFLPAYSEPCYSLYNEKHGLVDCDYPPEYLLKLFSRQLDSLPLVKQFLQNFNYRGQDQMSITSDAAFNGYSLETATCRWLLDNTDVWTKWIPAEPAKKNSSLWIIAIILPVSAIAICVVISGICIGIYICYSRHRREVDLRFAPRESPVTIVFTDLQNSTLLWEMEPKGMASTLDIHNSVIRRNITKFEGYEVKTQGDSFMIAFKSPTNALACCLAIQNQLLHANWPSEMMNYPDCREEVDEYHNVKFRGPRVRMGIHSGDADCQIDKTTGRIDYYGPTVNKAARIESKAIGGRIYVSSRFKDLVSSFLEENSSTLIVTKVGTFKLKGIEGEETVYWIRENVKVDGIIIPIRSSQFQSDISLDSPGTLNISNLEKTCISFMRNPELFTEDERRNVILSFVRSIQDRELRDIVRENEVEISPLPGMNHSGPS